MGRIVLDGRQWPDALWSTLCACCVRSIYNVAAEVTYDPNLFHGRVEHIPVAAGDTATLATLAHSAKYCAVAHAGWLRRRRRTVRLLSAMHWVTVAPHRSMTEWLETHPRGAIIVHCDTGFGRACQFAAAYLLVAQLVPTAADAIQLVAARRTAHLPRTACQLEDSPEYLAAS